MTVHWHDEQLDGPGTELGKVLADLARRDVHVRGLLWRSHPRQAHFSEQDNTALVREVNEAGGELVLDERVRRGGSHHQKLVLLRRARPEDDVAFVGGIDLCHGRRDDPRHRGDRRRSSSSPRYGDRPPWHDIQLEVRGPAVGDLADSSANGGPIPTPFDHRNPVRIVLRHLTRQPRRPDPLPPARPDPPPAGTAAVQVLRTYPSKRPPFPFAPDGERSIGRAYRKALSRAQRLVYLEDQYLWSRHAADTLADALRRSPDLHVIAVVPRFPEQSGRVAEASEMIGRQHVLETLYAAGGDRVAVYDLENQAGTPIYVHAKVCVVDDIWLEVGSDNLNRRSWTHDSELSCAMLDTELDPTRANGSRRSRRPRAPARARHAPPSVARAPGSSGRTGPTTATTPISSTSRPGSPRSAPPPSHWTRGTARAASGRDRPVMSVPTDRSRARGIHAGGRTQRIVSSSTRMAGPGLYAGTTRSDARTRYPVGQCAADDTTNVSSGSPPECRLHA